MNKNRKPFNKLYRNVLSSAKSPEEKGLGKRTVGRTEAREVTVTPEILEKIWNKQNEICALSGVKMNLDELYIPNSMDAPSVDRLDDKEGYHEWNIHIATRGMNKARGTSSVPATYNWVNTIKTSGMMQGPWYFPEIPYNEIFNKPIQNMLDEEEIGKIKIFRAPMGVGKTYSVFTRMVPELMLQKGVKAFWYFAPNTENINLTEIAEYTTKLWKKSNEYKSLATPMLLQIGGEYGNNYKLAETYLNLNQPVILCSTDSSISNTLLNKNSNGEYVPNKNAEFFRDLGDKFALIRDEIHYGATSDAKYLPENMGASDKTDYKARMFHINKCFLDTTPWTIGTTATPTKEMIKEEFGAEEYEIVNPWLTPKQCYGQLAWMGSMNTILDLKKYSDDNYLIKHLGWMISDMVNRQTSVENEIQATLQSPYLTDEDKEIIESITTKTSGMIKVDIDRKTEDGNGDKVSNDDKAYLRRVQRLLVKAGLPHNMNYIVTTNSGWIEYDYSGKETGLNGKAGCNNWIEELNNPNSDARIVVVVNKGDKGINVPSLTSGLIFRNPTPRDKKEKKWILRNPIQNVGRFVRPYYGGLTQEQLNKIPLNLSESILKNLNTFDITTPNSSQWIECRDELLDTEKGYVYEAHNIFGWPFKRKAV